MDPISQGTVGAVFAQSAAEKKNIGKISVVGFLAGLAPDLDVLIQSSTDPVLFLFLVWPFEALARARRKRPG